MQTPTRGLYSRVGYYGGIRFHRRFHLQPQSDGEGKPDIQPSVSGYVEQIISIVSVQIGGSCDSGSYELLRHIHTRTHSHLLTAV